MYRGCSWSHSVLGSVEGVSWSSSSEELLKQLVTEMTEV